jgi:hypothetical protein
MKKNVIIIIAAVLAVVLAGLITMRVRAERAHFDKTVTAALATSEGYDQKFIDMVNRLEKELARRASFGYTGGKDPMTGTKRQMVQVPAQMPAQAPSIEKPAPVANAAPVPVDQVKLTAIIADASGKKITAVVMDGERSYSVDQGDVVAGRKITKISNEAIFMENDSMTFFYDIYGKKEEKRKEGYATPKK